MNDETTLRPLPWQRREWSRAVGRVDADRLPHALLIAAAAGTGALQFSRALGARLLCPNAATDGACGACRICALLAAGTHPDFLQLRVEADSRVIKIGQVREVVDFAGKTASLGQRKIILLGPAEAMTLSAANALLKSLEEPGAGTVFLLFTHQPSAVAATVRSRCQRINLSTPSRDQSVRWLTPVAGRDAEVLLDLCADKPMEALALFRSGTMDERRAVIEALGALQEGKLSPLDLPGKVAELPLDVVIAMLQTHLESAVRQRVLAGEPGTGELFRLHDEFARQRAAITRGANPNRQLIIEDCATRLQTALGEWRS